MLALEEPEDSRVDLHAANTVRFKLAAPPECHFSLPVLRHIEMCLPSTRARALRRYT